MLAVVAVIFALYAVFCIMRSQLFKLSSIKAANSKLLGYL